MKKMITLMVILLTLVSGAFAAAWTGSTSEPESTRKIDGKSFYVITTANELAWFAAQVNSGKSTINAVLDNDIVFGDNTTTYVLCSIQWTPIGKDASHKFNGTFDGNGHTVYGIKAYDGFIGFTGLDAVVKNLKTQGGVITNGGGIVKENSGKIENLVNANRVEGKGIIGGIVGRNKGVISNSKNTGYIVIHTDYTCAPRGSGSSTKRDSLLVGGVVGLNEGTVSSLSNTNSPSVEVHSHGWTYTTASGSYYSSCNSVTDVYIGGIAGKNSSKGSISLSLNTGTYRFLQTVESTNGGSYANKIVGGVAGYNKGAILNSYTTKNSFVGTNEGSIKNCYSHDETSFWANNAKVSSSVENMKKDQFAWILNTTNGSTTNSKIWSRTDGFPIFATSTYKPIVRIVFNDDGATTKKYSTNKGTVTFPSNSTPATGYIFDGWYNGSTKVSSSTVFSADATVSTKYLDTSTITYTIKFYNDDKTTLLASQSVGYGETPVYSGATPTKAATAQYSYAFSKWDRTLAAAYQDTSYFAVYTSTVNSYDIVFEDYDGLQLQSSAVNYGVTPAYAEVPTRISTEEWNYEFNGWSPEIASVTGAATYTAVYDSSKVQYAITFNNYDGTKLSTVNVNYGTVPSYSEIPARTGSSQWAYTFKNWSPMLTAVTKAATYTAVYDSTVAEHDVFFKDYDDAILQATKLEYGTMPTAPTAPSRTATAEWSYTFAGWDKELASVSGTSVYTAMYDSTKNSYEVTFVDFDNSELQKTTLEYGETPVCSQIPARESSAEWNYEFKGWNPAIASVTGKTTYKAVFDSTKVMYAVSLMSEGSAVLTENVAYGETFTIPRGIAKDGYTFVGWYVGEDLLGNIGDVIVITQNISAEAKYSINSYMVKFLDYDGTVLKKDSYEYGSIPVYGSTVSREASAEWNYEFIGWTPAIAKVIKAGNYTATYDSTKVKYEVVFMNGSEEVDAQEVEYGAAAKKPADPKKAGFTFAGWNKDFSNVTKNLVIEAIFEEKRPTIIANTILKDVSVTIVNKNLQISGAIVDVDVFDLQGRLLKTLRNVQGSVNFSTMPSGNYIIRVSSGAQNFTQRISLK